MTSRNDRYASGWLVRLLFRKTKNSNPSAMSAKTTTIAKAAVFTVGRDLEVTWLL